MMSLSLVLRACVHYLLSVYKNKNTKQAQKLSKQLEQNLADRLRDSAWFSWAQAIIA